MITTDLETARILLRPLSIADAETIFNNWAHDLDVARYMNWNLHQSVKDTVEWLTLEEINIAKETNYTWGFVLKENQGLFGSGGINYNEEFEMFELGYCIMKKYWNLGLTTEAVKAILDFAVQKIGVVTFLGRHAKENPASGKVLEKAGFIFQKEGKFSSFDGRRTFESKEYLFSVNSIIS